MVDVAAARSSRAREADDAARATRACEPGEYVLATAHRAGNVDDPARLRALVDLLLALPTSRSSCRCTRARGARLEAAGLLDELAGGRRTSACAAAGLPGLHLAARPTRARC